MAGRSTAKFVRITRVSPASNEHVAEFARLRVTVAESGLWSAASHFIQMDTHVDIPARRNRRLKAYHRLAICRSPPREPRQERSAGGATAHYRTLGSGESLDLERAARTLDGIPYNCIRRSARFLSPNDSRRHNKTPIH